MIKYLKDNLPANYQHKNNVKVLKERLTNKILMGDIKLNNGQEADKEYWLKFYFDNKSSLSDVSESNFKILKRYSKKDSFGSLEIDERLLESIFGKVTKNTAHPAFDTYISHSRMTGDGEKQRDELTYGVLKYKFKHKILDINEKTLANEFLNRILVQSGVCLFAPKPEKLETLGDMFVYSAIVKLKGEKNALKAAELLLEAYDKTDDQKFKKRY